MPQTTRKLSCEFAREFDTYVVDLSVEIRSKACLIKNNKYTYRQFVALVLESISSRAKRAKVQQIELVVDVYYNVSIKSGTRSNRVVSSQILFNLDDLIAKNFENLF